MALRSFGWVTVTVAGTPERVTTNSIRAHAVFIQQVTGNTGAMHIGLSASMDPADGTDMIATLPIPTTNVLPSYSTGVDHASAGVNLNELWIDAGVSGEEVLISYLEA